MRHGNENSKEEEGEEEEVQERELTTGPRVPSGFR